MAIFWAGPDYHTQLLQIVGAPEYGSLGEIGVIPIGYITKLRG